MGGTAVAATAATRGIRDVRPNAFHPNFRGVDEKNSPATVSRISIVFRHTQEKFKVGTKACDWLSGSFERGLSHIGHAPWLSGHSVPTTRYSDRITTASILDAAEAATVIHPATP